MKAIRIPENERTSDSERNRFVLRETIPLDGKLGEIRAKCMQVVSADAAYLNEFSNAQQLAWWILSVIDAEPINGVERITALAADQPEHGLDTKFCVKCDLSRAAKGQELCKACIEDIK